MKHAAMTGLLIVGSLGAGCAPSTPMTMSMECAVPATTVMHSGFISASERWASGTHVITSTVTVRDGVTLAIDGCSRVQLAPDASIDVTGTNARLQIDGSNAAPVRLERLQSDRAWGRILVRGTGSASLRSTTLAGGGGTAAQWRSADFLGSALAAQGDAALLPNNVTIVDSSVLDATGIAIVMVASRFDASSSNVTIHGAGAFPLYIGADGATEIPSGDWSSNGINEILLHSASVGVYSNTRAIVRDTVIHDRSLPYRVGIEDSSDGLIRVGDGRGDGPASALLEIEPGVTLKFAAGGGNSGLYVQGRMVDGRWTMQGALRAVGTAERPITFTSASATPAAGNWTGLYFKDVMDPRTRVEHAVIEFAGGDSSTRGVCASNGTGDIDADAAVIVSLQPGAAAPTQFVTNTVIRASANAGVYRNWDTQDVDFTPTNSFEALGGCRQSGVRAALGGCSTMGCM